MAGLVAINITQGCRIKVTPINRLKPGANQVILDLSGGGHIALICPGSARVPTYLTARQSLLSVASQDFRSGKLLAQPHLGRINFERFSNGHWWICEYSLCTTYCPTLSQSSNAGEQVTYRTIYAVRRLWTLHWLCCMPTKHHISVNLQLPLDGLQHCCTFATHMFSCTG